MVAYARKTYQESEADAHLSAIYFDEDEGNHAFPPGVRASAYRWLDGYLKT
jgi:hypothetical protein